MTTGVLVGGDSARLREQLASLGVERVVAVGADVAAVAAAVRAAPPGTVVLAAADVFTQREALAGVLADPRLGSAILSGRAARPRAHPLRSERGRVLSAGSEFHAVTEPGEWFLGVLKVLDADRAALLAAADRIAALGLPGDPVALLLVGLVRSGTHVGQSDLRALFWARPRSEEERAAAERDVRGHDEERVLLDSSVKAVDGFFTTFFVSPYSKHVARWAARRGLTPNQVTAVSLGLGVLAAAAFATGERWGLVAGAVLLQVAFTTDCVDGQLARFTRTFTPLGAWLDSTFDRLKEYLVYLGLAVGADAAGEPVWALAGAALTLQVVRHAMDFGFAAAENRTVDAAPPRPLDEPGDGGGGAPAQALAAWRRTDRVPGLAWVKRIVAFPIGERFLAISLTAALWDARVTFVVLLAGGALAAAYGSAGRILRALSHRAARGDRAAQPSPSDGQPARSGEDGLMTQREDGPLARALAAAAAVPLPASALVLAGVAPLGAGLALGAPAWPFVAWLVLAGSASGAARRDGDPLAWAVPALLRAGEYAAYVWLSPSGALPLLVVLAFGHYDLVYRPRYQRRVPPGLAGGWELRLLAALALDAAGALPAGMWAAAGILGALLGAEAAASWRNHHDERDASA